MILRRRILLFLLVASTPLAALATENDQPIVPIEPFPVWGSNSPEPTTPTTPIWGSGSGSSAGSGTGTGSGGSSSGFINVGEADPAAPRCQAERTLKSLYNGQRQFKIEEYGDYQPPGTIIMRGPFSQFPENGWVKIQFTSRIVQKPDPYSSTYFVYRPAIHVMYNTITYRTEQFRFVNPLGCTPTVVNG